LFVVITTLSDDLLMEKGPYRITAERLQGLGLSVKNLDVTLGRLAMETDFEKPGLTPKPSLTSLRDWDMKLLSRYKPFYAPICDQCCLCTYGKCDLTRGKKGACGIEMHTQQARTVLFACTIGAATHTAHARHLVNHLIRKYGSDHPIALGYEVNVEMPHARTVLGIKPTTLADLEYICGYVEEQLTHALSAVHTGQESSYLDFESKALHVGMLDHLAMEAADIAQIVTYNFPKGDANAPLAQIGTGVLDLSKPAILSIGHNVADSVEIIDYMEKHNLGHPSETVEVAGLCCTALDMTRYHEEAKIIGPMSHELRFIRSGISDVLVLDEQCINTGSLVEAQKVRTPVLAASEKACYGLPDLTERKVDEIVDALATYTIPGALVLDPEKVGAVATLVALRVASVRKKQKLIPDSSSISKLAAYCSECGKCRRNCPINLPISEAVFAAKRGDLSKLAQIYDLCLGCARCENECPHSVPVHSLIVGAAENKFRTQKYRVRVGRGPILDTEIRNVGQPIVFGEIPGVVAYVGCSNFPNGGIEVAKMAEIFLKRRYIVLASGCSAMSIAEYQTENGTSLYEEYPGGFEGGGLVNVGSCVANAHITGACMKIANIYARRPLRGNYEEIADYTLLRIGACGVAWGAMSQKAASIATGCNRLGIPVILGPQGSKYRRLFLGRRDDVKSFEVIDARSGEKSSAVAQPEHLLYAAESMEEAIVLTSKLCIRPADTTKGRMIKLTHYVDLTKKTYGRLPEDLPLHIRTEADIPITYKDEIVEFLREKGWHPSEKPAIDPTLLQRLVHRS
jgi:acetyl-CoA decarbonylase/synthase complex subunit alpha